MPRVAASQRRPKILLVDDNEDDILLARHAFKQSELEVELHAVNDGVEGLQFLRRQAHYDSAPRPDVILLDLNMPRMDGREMLRAIKADQQLKSIPTIILTTSDSDRDISESYQSHANGYVTKPAGFNDFRAIVRDLHRFWFGIARLPHVPAAMSLA